MEYRMAIVSGPASKRHNGTSAKVPMVLSGEDLEYYSIKIAGGAIVLRFNENTTRKCGGYQDCETYIAGFHVTD